MLKYYRKKFNKHFSLANDEDFVQMLWAAHALQSEYPQSARSHFIPDTIPEGVITTDMRSKHFIQKWEIETLANELMTVPKLRPSNTGLTRKLNCDNYRVPIECVNRLRKLENAEYGIRRRGENVFAEMNRIANRQFDWQRGYVNLPQFYRNAFVYGQGECAEFFEREYGISFERFSYVGFLLYVSFTQNPVVKDDVSWVSFGITRIEIESVLRLVSFSFSDAARIARRERRGTVPTADRPSILRRAPCLRFGDHGERIRAPLPELVIERITSGVFYDVVKGGGSVRDDYGRRFEKYCFLYLSSMLSCFEWEQETRYRKKSNSYLSPDILCVIKGRLNIAIECKATRMSQEAMFGKDQMLARGFEDIIKAVFQLWRFFSHCRRGHAGFELADSTTGVVLTLDNWLVMAEKHRESVLHGAVKMAEEKDLDISEEDRKPIVFVSISELERTLSTSIGTTFLEALNAANSKKYFGWRLDGIHRDLQKDNEYEENGYPFVGDIVRLLPWFSETGLG